MPLQEALFMLAGAGMVLAIIGALLLLRERALPSRFLAIALLLAAANILHALLGIPGAGSLLVEPLQFTLPPLFAAYVKALFNPDWRPRWRNLIHFGPCALFSAGAIFINELSPPAPFDLIVSLAFWIALLVQAMLYVGWVLFSLRRYHKSLQTEKSNLEGLDPRWLRRFSQALHLLYLGYLAVPALVIHLDEAQPARHAISLVMCAAFGYLAIHQILGRRQEVWVAPPESPPRQPSGYDPLLPAALQQAMDEQRLFANPVLDLSGLAAKLGWPRNEVSAAINGHFGCSFYDFINGYRVREAQRLMADPANSQLTILALALQAGFNSKPTFNAVFKKTTGQTPSAWQKAQNLV